MIQPFKQVIAFMAATNYIHILILVIISCPLSHAQSRDEKLVAEAVERYRNAMVNPDHKVLADLVSDDLVYVHSSGAVRDKRGFIDEFVLRQTDVSSVIFSNQSITVSGNNAMVRNRMVADSRKAGYPPVIDIIVLMVWRKEQGKWKMLARQAAKIPEPTTR